MQPLYTEGYQRPSRLQGAKNQKYDLAMSKALLGEVNSSIHNEFIIKSMVNWAFYKGNQWIFNEDLEAFMMDESGAFRNRIKLVNNIIRPFVEFHRGNAIRNDFKTRARSLSKAAINRREDSLRKMMDITKLSQALSPILKDGVQNEFAIGDTVQETERIHKNLYVDNLEETMTLFVDKIANDNDLDDMRVQLTQHTCLDGVNVLKEVEWAGEQVWKVQNPWYWIFDHSCQRPDFTDGEYMGSWDMMVSTDIFERFQNLSYSNKKVLEKYTTNSSGWGLHSLFSFSHKTRRVPVYDMYWRDGEFQEYAFIEDDYGYPVFTRINAKDTPYTDNDIIDPPAEFSDKLLGTKTWSSEKKKARLFHDYLRYCIFAPGEYVGGTQRGEDIVFESGKYPYSDPVGYGKGNIQFPYCARAWSYVNGEILSPVDALIDPQRFMNRTMSVAESQINNSRGAGTIYDKSIVDSQGGEEDLQRKMNQSQPIGVNARGQLNNMLGKYDNTIGEGTFALFKVHEQMKTVTQGMIGGGEALQGGGTSVRATGKVQELNINQGSIMQEPIYYAVNRVLLAAHNNIASRGKLIYINNPRELAIAVGDKGARILELTREMALEDFRMYLERTSSREDQAAEVNQLLLLLKQYQLVDDVQIANLFNNGSMDDVGRAMREFQGILAERRAQMEKSQSRQADAALKMQAAEQGLANLESDKLMMQQDIQNEASMQHDLDREMVRKIL